MKIAGTRTEVSRIEVDVSPRDMVDNLRRWILSTHKLPVDAYINDKGQIVDDEEHYTSHSWTTTRVVREAPTEDEVRLVKTLEALIKIVGQTLDIEHKKGKSK